MKEQTEKARQVQRESVVSEDTGENNPPPLFVSNNDPSANEFDRIVSVVLHKDVLKDYDRLERELVIGEQRNDYSVILKAVDKAEDNARKAHRIFLAAKIERESNDLESKRTKAAMWKAARLICEEEKEEGKHKKQITDSDVEAQCNVMFPDEWASLARKSLQYKSAEAHLEEFARLWQSRCNTLRTILHTLRK